MPLLLREIIYDIIYNIILMLQNKKNKNLRTQIKTPSQILKKLNAVSCFGSKYVSLRQTNIKANTYNIDFIN